MTGLARERLSLGAYNEYGVNGVWRGKPCVCVCACMHVCLCSRLRVCVCVCVGGFVRTPWVRSFALRRVLLQIRSRLQSTPACVRPPISMCQTCPKARSKGQRRFWSSANKFACYMWEGYKNTKKTAHRTRVRHMRHARLEAGRVRQKVVSKRRAHSVGSAAAAAGVAPLTRVLSSVISSS